MSVLRRVTNNLTHATIVFEDDGSFSTAERTSSFRLHCDLHSESLIIPETVTEIIDEDLFDPNWDVADCDPPGYDLEFLPAWSQRKIAHSMANPWEWCGTCRVVADEQPARLARLRGRS